MTTEIRNANAKITSGDHADGINLRERLVSSGLLLAWLIVAYRLCFN